jgi:hypothetical protein
LNSAKLIDRLGNGFRQREAGKNIQDIGATDLAFLSSFEDAVKHLQKEKIYKNRPNYSYNCDY